MNFFEKINNQNIKFAAILWLAICIPTVYITNQSGVFSNQTFTKTTLQKAQFYLHRNAHEYDSYVTMHLQLGIQRTNIMKTVHVCSQSPAKISIATEIYKCSKSPIQDKRYES